MLRKKPKNSIFLNIFIHSATPSYINFAFRCEIEFGVGFSAFLLFRLSRYCFALSLKLVLLLFLRSKNKNKLSILFYLFLQLLYPSFVPPLITNGTYWLDAQLTANASKIRIILVPVCVCSCLSPSLLVLVYLLSWFPQGTRAALSCLSSSFCCSTKVRPCCRPWSPVSGPRSLVVDLARNICRIILCNRSWING